jgi:predicted small lipoprotein YifL
MNGRTRLAVFAAFAAAAAASCGQQGPLVLPSDERPVERVDPTAVDPELSDDERQDER